MKRPAAAVSAPVLKKHASYNGMNVAEFLVFTEDDAAEDQELLHQQLIHAGNEEGS